MDLQTEKIELAKRLLETDDESVLRQIKKVFESHDKDFWSDLPNHVKEVSNGEGNRRQKVS